MLYREFRYDAAGRRLDPNTRILQHGDGSHTEIHNISGVNAWTFDGLHDIGFGTKGASLAQTTFDPESRPIETVFTDSEGNELSRIAYACDSSGNVVEAVQHAGAALDANLAEWAAKASPAQRDASRAFIGPGAVQFRVVFRYDDAGRLVEQSKYFAQSIIDHTVMAYNEHGDMSASVTDNQPQARFEYEYDERRNWIRKRVLQTWKSELVSSDEYRRTLTYYD